MLNFQPQAPVDITSDQIILNSDEKKKEIDESSHVVASPYISDHKNHKKLQAIVMVGKTSPKKDNSNYLSRDFT